jgi:integrase
MSVRKDRLGHASAEMTLAYTHSASADHRNIAEALGKLFDPIFEHGRK